MGQLHRFSECALSHFPSPHFTHDPPEPGGIGALQPKASKFLWSQEFVAIKPSQQVLQSTQDPPAISPSLAQARDAFVFTAEVAFALAKEKHKKRSSVILNVNFTIREFLHSRTDVFFGPRALWVEPACEKFFR